MTRSDLMTALTEATKIEMETLFRVLRIGMTSRDEGAPEKFGVGLGVLMKAHDAAAAAIAERTAE